MIPGAAGLSRLLAVALLGAIAVQNYAMTRRTPDLQRYHARIREIAAQIQPRIGSWIGQDVPVPTRAVTTLRPNVLISRRYVNVETSVSAGLLLVQCMDAHHMVGHYPLRCYPAEGWTLLSSMPRDWTIGDLHLTGMEYEFNKQEIGEQMNTQQRIIVDNCLLRPGGVVLRDMEGLSDSILGAEGQASGAGQVQVYFDATVPQHVRDDALRALVGGYLPVIDAILAHPDAGLK